MIKHWHIIQANQSCKETFSTVPTIAFRKGTSLKEIIGTNTIHNNEKLIKTKINHHTRKCVPFISTNCLCCQQLILQQHWKVIKPIKRLKITRESTAKAASLFIHENAISATFSTLQNQKHHSTLGSISTEKMWKIPMQFRLENISTGTIMTLTITERSLS